MIKMPSMVDFMSLPEFDLDVGLCVNMSVSIQEKLSMLFEVYLNQRGLYEHYPIGTDDYVRQGSRTDLRFLRNSYHAAKLYSCTKNKYEGKQGELRTQLYEAFCIWLVETRPDQYQL